MTERNNENVTVKTITIAKAYLENKMMSSVVAEMVGIPDEDVAWWCGKLLRQLADVRFGCACVNCVDKTFNEIEEEDT